MKHHVEIEQLLDAGAHFGHLTRRWNPKMSKFIFTERNGIHIIDLRKTQVLVDAARNIIQDVASKGRVILFVGTKIQARGVVEEQAKKCASNYVTERWLGGMLTNFSTIRKSIKRLAAIDKMEVDGTFEKITKKERLLLTRERDRLRKVFGGIEDMTRLPGALFVVDIKKEHIAVKEAKILDIPIIALVDTNCDPEDVDFPIPANDDSIKAIELISKVMSDAILDGTQILRSRQAEMSSEQERLAKESDQDIEEQPKIQRRLRERRAPRQGEKGTKTKGKPVRQSEQKEKSEPVAEEPKQEQQ